MCSPMIMEKVRSEVSRRGVLRIAGAIAASGLATSVARVAAQDATPMASPGAAGPGSLGVALGSFTQIQDLTHTITPAIPLFPGNPQPVIEPFRTYETDGYYANKLMYAEHSGTHMDAPAHFIEGELFADQLPVERFLAPLAVIDITGKSASDPDAQVTADDLLAWEEANGPFPAGAFVAMNSGWSAKIHDPEAFINAGADGVLHFPGFHPDATQWLLDEREIAGLGVDTLSLDFGASTDFGTHIALLGSGRYGIEGLASLGSIPASGGLVIVGGPKFMNASGGPSRVLALYP